MYANKAHRENARWEQHKNTALSKSWKQHLHKTVTVRPPTSHLTNPSSKTNKA